MGRDTFMLIDERTAVYRFFSESGDLLYVGMSRDPDLREYSHARLAAETWYALTARRTEEWHEDRVAAEKAEFEAITNEAPLFNVQGNYYDGPDWRAQFDERKRRMKALMQTGDQPLYRLLMAYFLGEIERGAIPAGTKLQNRRIYAEDFGVGPETVKHALDRLAREGVLLRVPSSGYYVGRQTMTASTVSVPLDPVEAAAVLRDELTPKSRRELARLLGED